MPESRDEFYVGYLPLPAGYLRFVRIAVPSLLWIMVLAAAAVALFQRSPGIAVWDQGKPVERTGVLNEKPYPHIVDGASVVFLVEQGKRGAQERTRGMDGKRVLVRGWKLERDGREILELVPEASGVKPNGVELDLRDSASMSATEGVLASAVPEVRLHLGITTLLGEIVDYKCYLGAMKPGDGKAHKACAILCMTGGIPAMLVSHDPAGPRYTLLMDERGGPVGKDIIELAGEPVVVSGVMAERSSVRMLRVQGIRRQ